MRLDENHVKRCNDSSLRMNILTTSSNPLFVCPISLNIPEPWISKLCKKLPKKKVICLPLLSEMTAIEKCQPFKPEYML